MAKLPSGTVTLLFTDVDRSTELVKKLQERYGAVLAKHRDLLRAEFANHGGTEVDTQGDAFFVAFGHARDAVEAAVAAQRALADYPWPDGAALSVRMGLHTGEPYPAEHGYTGVAVHRAARICTIGHGGQVLLSRSTAGIIDDEEIPSVALRDLGEHRLKDIDRPERIFQLLVEGLPAEFPPLRTIDRGRRTRDRRVLRHGDCGFSKREARRPCRSCPPASRCNPRVAARAEAEDERRAPFRGGSDRLDRAGSVALH
jgi:class 3 adenylate cyclase